MFVTRKSFFVTGGLIYIFFDRFVGNKFEWMSLGDGLMSLREMSSRDFILFFIHNSQLQNHNRSGYEVEQCTKLLG